MCKIIHEGNTNCRDVPLQNKVHKLTPNIHQQCTPLKHDSVNVLPIHCQQTDFQKYAEQITLKHLTAQGWKHDSQNCHLIRTHIIRLGSFPRRSLALLGSINASAVAHVGRRQVRYNGFIQTRSSRRVRLADAVSTHRVHDGAVEVDRCTAVPRHGAVVPNGRAVKFICRVSVSSERRSTVGTVSRRLHPRRQRVADILQCHRRTSYDTKDTAVVLHDIQRSKTAPANSTRTWQTAHFHTGYRLASWSAPCKQPYVIQGPDLQKYLTINPKFSISLSQVIKLIFSQIFTCNLLKQSYYLLSSSDIYADNSVKKCSVILRTFPYYVIFRFV